MRKLAKVLLAATVVMSMGLTALAAPSVSSSYELASSTITGKSGATLELAVQASSTTITAADAVTALGLSVDSSEVAVVVQDIELVTGDYDDIDFPLSVTLSMSGVTSGMEVYVLHYTDGAWQEETATAGDGTITISGIDSLSPFAIVVSDAVATSSPTTGQASTTAIVMMAVVALGTALVVSKRKVA